MTGFTDFLEKIDLFFFRYFNFDWTHNFFDIFFPAITDLHKTPSFKFILVPLVFIMLLYFKRSKGLLIFWGLAVSLGVGDFLGGKLKHLIGRSRPFEEAIGAIQRSDAGGYSFPSNHSLNMFCMAIFLSYFFPRFKYVFFTVAILIGLSRIYNGVHYPSDVLGGAVIGTVIGYAGAKLTNLLIHKISHRKSKNA